MLSLTTKHDESYAVASAMHPTHGRPDADGVPHGSFIKSLQTSPLWKDPFRNPNVFLYLKVNFLRFLLLAQKRNGLVVT